MIKFYLIILLGTDHQMDEKIPENDLIPKNLLSFKKIKSDFLLDKHDAYEYEDEDLEFKYEKIWKRFVDYLDSNFEDFIWGVFSII